MGKRIVFIWLCLIYFVLPGVVAQEGSAWPKLERSYVNHYYRKDDSYSKKCFNSIFFDKQGRLWLGHCGSERLINSIGLFQFDGYTFQPVEVFSPTGSVIESPEVIGLDEQGRLWGTTEGRWSLFRMNPDTHETSLIPPDDPSFNNMRIADVSIKGTQIMVLGFPQDGPLALFQVKGDKLAKEHDFDQLNFTQHSRLPTMFINQKDIWLTNSTLPLYRFNRQKKTTRTYRAQDFIGHPMIQSPEIIYDIKRYPKLLQSKNGNTFLYFSITYGNLLFQLDHEKDQFVSIAQQFPAGWRPAGLFQDQLGNICFLFQDKTEAYRAVLETSSGQRFDYSAIVAGQKNIVSLAAEDFQRQVFLLTRDGLHHIGIRTSGLIQQALRDEWISAMASLPDGRLLVNTVNNGWFVYEKTTGKTAPFSGPACSTQPPVFGRGMKEQIIPDNQGNLWFMSYHSLVRYAPATNDCHAFNLGVKGKLFGLLRSGLVVFQNDRNRISFFDLNTQKTVSFGPGVQETFSGFIRDILVDTHGILWIPTNDGLWRIDIDQEKSEVLGLEDGFADYRFTTIYEDTDGRLWLGTYFGGLHIYDPQTGSITVIDQGQGLSNNAIMSIIADDDGDMWVGTEYGINLVSREGEVQNSIYQEDGLTYEVFERFDPFKGEDGRLYFGSRHGISIINPSVLKADNQRDSLVQIYLTELGYFDKKKGKDVIQKRDFQQIGTVDISPERPYLHLKFALSRYLEAHNNRYAYRLEGRDDDWHYLGTQPELNISRLPPGKYRLLIKGADFRNNWTKTPVAINIHAREFFYKQIWFYLLATLPFLVFALIWARNKQLEARRLEREVMQRTQKIREDKAVIETQAAELQQLDRMKSRFFTNISHELRTPITLIKGPLEHLMQKHGATLDEKIRRSLKLALNNAGKLGALVEELLELSSLEAQKVTLHETPTPLNLFCRQLFGAYESGAALKQIHYRYRSNLEDDAHFLIDRNRLEKIINNLLSNALKFTPPEGTVDMMVGREAMQLLIAVQDSGRGIPPEDLPYLFDRYFQTRREDLATEGGTGIGLALSKELALLMKGDIEVESTWGTGACFTLRIPAKEALPTTEELASPIASAMHPEEHVEKRPSVSPTGNTKPNVLIVEDNPDMQQLIQEVLDDHYTCLIANDGAEAWTWLETNDQAVADIELILSDVMMPQMDGYTLLEKIKTHEHWQKLPVVMLTARSAEKDKLQALRLGVDDYLLKPFSPEELKARMFNLIANYQVRKRIAADLASSKVPTLPESPVAGLDISFEPLDSANARWLKEVEDAAREALDKGIKLTAVFLADSVFLSERQFARKLKAHVGLTPNEYIQEVKLQKARHLLEHRAYTTVNEVAVATGYSSGSYLTRMYQERFGKKPGDYF